MVSQEAFLRHPVAPSPAPPSRTLDDLFGAIPDREDPFLLKGDRRAQMSRILADGQGEGHRLRNLKLVVCAQLR